MIEFRAERSGWQRRVHFWVVDRGNQQTAVAEPLTFRFVDNRNEMTDPSFTVEDDEAQQLMDELWRCGLRPTEGSGSAGSLAATERHLEDMRRLVFERRSEEVRVVNVKDQL